MHLHPRPTVTTAWISLLAALLLGGCTSTKESVLPQDGPSMKAIYDAHFAGMGADDPINLRHALGDRPSGTTMPISPGIRARRTPSLKRSFRACPIRRW